MNLTGCAYNINIVGSNKIFWLGVGIGVIISIALYYAFVSYRGE